MADHCHIVTGANMPSDGGMAGKVLRVMAGD